MSKFENPVFCAVDTTNVDAALALAASVREHVGGLKLGLEFFSANGPDGVRAIADIGLPIFLDLKLHDIPNTVASTIKALMPLAPAIMTIHAQGGGAMMKAASEAASEAAEELGIQRPRLVGVTVLTSLDENDLANMNIRAMVEGQVLSLARLAKHAGLDGIVCSPQELGPVRNEFGDDFLTVVPGIRPEGAALGDQKRVMTPPDATRAGADVLVIGSPITDAN